MNARGTLAELLRRGFRGTCAAAAMETGLAKNTVHVRLRSLEAEGLAEVVATERSVGGRVNIWAATGHTEITRARAQAGIVAHALAARQPLERWAAGEPPA